MNKHKTNKMLKTDFFKNITDGLKIISIFMIQFLLKLALGNKCAKSGFFSIVDFSELVSLKHAP